ncbi:response regulator [Asticcacaulis sp. YBE204]|uniref:response regulator n=1 Tax=Asticcacaulis sp. YBE204 TaxID=1282363 RepID=UPI0003C3E795|nr:response regulator [Asticcacaulis sp. YBE204]ESQ79130.1 histidine kinase [Asticcacaulis sp. YBE204]
MTLEILLVEDNEGDVEMTRRALKRAEPPCRVSVANNGQQALEFLKKEGRFEDVPTPQLILLDINMPRMDGKMFLSHVKALPDFKAIPVVMFTSSESPADIRECYERFASAYVVKPFDGQKYAEAVRQVVRFWGETGQLPA